MYQRLIGSHKSSVFCHRGAAESLYEGKHVQSGLGFTLPIRKRHRIVVICIAHSDAWYNLIYNLPVQQFKHTTQTLTRVLCGPNPPKRGCHKQPHVCLKSWHHLLWVVMIGGTKKDLNRRQCCCWVSVIQISNAGYKERLDQSCSLAK